MPEPIQEPMPEPMPEPIQEPMPEPIQEPMPEPEIEQPYENDNEQEEELFNSIARNVDNLLRNTDDISANLSGGIVRSITNNLHSYTPLHHINITTSDIFDIFNNDLSLNTVNRREFINRYSDPSNNIV